MKQAKEKEIQIKYLKEVSMQLVSVNYNKFLKKIQSLYCIPNEKMESIRITYKDPDDEVDNEANYILIENQSEFGNCLNESDDIIILVSFNDDKTINNEDVEKQLQHQSQSQSQSQSEPQQPQIVLPIKQIETKTEIELTIIPPITDNSSTLQSNNMITSLMSKQNKTIEDIQLSLQNLQDENKLLKAKLTEIEKSFSIATESIKANDANVKQEIKDIIKERFDKLNESIESFNMMTIAKSQLIHRGINCINCNVKPIKGIRYQCSQCKDIGLCELCFKQGIHSEHIFLHILNSEAYQIQLDAQQKEKEEEDKQKSKALGPFNLFSPINIINISLESSKSLLNKDNIKDEIPNSKDKDKDNNAKMEEEKEKKGNEGIITNKGNKNKDIRDSYENISSDNIKQMSMSQDITSIKDKENKGREMRQRGMRNKAYSLKNTNEVKESQLPQQYQQWKKQYEEMNRLYSISNFESETVVLKMIDKHNGNIETAFKEIINNM